MARALDFLRLLHNRESLSMMKNDTFNDQKNVNVIVFCKMIKYFNGNVTKKIGKDNNIRKKKLTEIFTLKKNYFLF